MLRISLGFFLVCLGGLMTIYSEKMLNGFGRITFFERKLRTYGGSRLGYKLLGLLVSFVGMLLIANLYNSFMEGVLSPLIEATKRGAV